MTAEQFLMCLRRFIGRRGKPSNVIYDKAPQFKLVSTVFDKLWQNMLSNEKVISYIASENIQWKFIIERAPWMGGFYERLVALCKNCLRKSIGYVCLSLIQLQTIIVELEAVLNSRPLVYVGSDFDSNGYVLTPGHFLSPNPKTGIPSFDINEIQDPNYAERLSSKDCLIENWKRGQKYLEVFWKIWKDGYLLNLRERTQRSLKHPHCTSQVAPHVGSIVHIKNDGPRGSWVLGRIQKLLPGSDSEIRSAKVKLPSGTVLTRALIHLYPLECDGTTEIIDEPKVFNDENPITVQQIRPKRQAAVKASSKICQIAEYEDSD